MMKHIYILFTSLLIFFLLEGCTSKGKLAEQFPPLKELKADSISTPPILLSVTRLFITNNMLVAYQQRSDTMFSFWKLPECSYLFRAGSRGEGPDDFLMLDRTFQEMSSGFKTFAIASNKVKEVAVDPIGSFKVVSAKQLEVDQRGLNRFLFLKNNSYCFVSDKEEYEYALLDEDGVVHYFGNYPEGLLEKKEDDLNRFVYNKLTIANPQGNKFAAFYAYIKLCRIYNAKGELLKETMLESLPKNASEEKTIYYSSYPYADENYIYVLTDKEEGKVLEIWDWEGVPKAHYLLDKPVNCLVKSSTDGKLYAVCQDREDVVYVYSVP